MSEIPPKRDTESGSDASRESLRTSVRHIEVSNDHDGQRIDNFLISELKTIPRSLVYRILRTGQVRVNKGRIKPSFRLSEGDIVRIPPVTVPAQQQIRVPKSVVAEVAASVIHDDHNWIVINKPAGLAVHAGTGVTFGIIDAIKEAFDDQSISLVHRLDRSTSGVMALARNRRAAAHFHESLTGGLISKHYSALLCGVMRSDKKTVNAKLRKTHPTPNENQVLIDPAGGKAAVSHFSCHTKGKRFSLANVEIETGRTHQIRVHGASIGHPVLGDERYGDEKLNNEVKRAGAKRMFLHARELSFPDVGQSPDVGHNQSNDKRQPSAPLQRTFSVPIDPEWMDVVHW